MQGGPAPAAPCLKGTECAEEVGRGLLGPLFPAATHSSPSTERALACHPCPAQGQIGEQGPSLPLPRSSCDRLCAQPPAGPV